MTRSRKPTNTPAPATARVVVVWRATQAAMLSVLPSAATLLLLAPLTFMYFAKKYRDFFFSALRLRVSEYAVHADGWPTGLLS